jgi:hypothetical protein
MPSFIININENMAKGISHILATCTTLVFQGIVQKCYSEVATVTAVLFHLRTFFKYFI